MAYLGENKYFSFRDGFCEAVSEASVTSREAAELGRTLTRYFSRFCVGCDGFGQLHILYALCSGISECGKDVYVCENTDMPSFRFGSPLLSADCGVFIGGGGSLKLSFFDRRGFALPEKSLIDILRTEPPLPSDRSGRINVSTSFRSIYINNIRDNFNLEQRLPAGVSCGSRSVRSLWNEFFVGEDDELVFQVSDDGQRVNAYSSAVGFISADNLTLAYCMKKTAQGETVFLPDSFHYAAENDNILRFSAENGVPESEGSSRFLKDPLFMCVDLASDKEGFIRILREMPRFASAKREIVFASPELFDCPKKISSEKGRVIISRSGRSRLSLLAQSLSSETAAELCAQWCEKLRKLDDCRPFSGDIS